MTSMENKNEQNEKYKILHLLDQVRENVIVETYSPEDLITLKHEILSLSHKSNKESSAEKAREEKFDKEVSFYQFLGWWICYLKEKTET